MARCRYGACFLDFSFLVGTSLLNDNSILCPTVHRDIKPSNILVFENKKGETVIKLSDFGMSKEMSGTVQSWMTTGVGTQGWRSAEVVRGLENVKVSRLYPTAHQIGDNKPVKPAPRQGIYGPCPPLGVGGEFRPSLPTTV